MKTRHQPTSSPTDVLKNFNLLSGSYIVDCSNTAAPLLRHAHDGFVTRLLYACSSDTYLTSS
jgi:hypothetical protein